MARTKDGWEFIQLSLPTEDAKYIKVLAAMEGRTHGEIVQAMITAFRRGAPSPVEMSPYADGEVLDRLRRTLARQGAAEPAPDKHDLRAEQHTVRLDRKVPERDQLQERPTVAPSTPQGRRKVGTETMTWDELVAGLEATGKSHKELRDHLGLTNISPWAKDGVPPRHVPKIKAFLGG